MLAKLFIVARVCVSIAPVATPVSLSFTVINDFTRFNFLIQFIYPSEPSVTGFSNKVLYKFLIEALLILPSFVPSKS